MQFQGLALAEPHGANAIWGLNPFERFEALLHVLSRLVHPLLFGAGCFLMPQSTCILVAFFFAAFRLASTCRAFFRCFFDGGFEAIALAHRLFVSSRLSFALFFFLSQIVGVVTPEFRKYRRL